VQQPSVLKSAEPFPPSLPPLSGPYSSMNAGVGPRVASPEGGRPTHWPPCRGRPISVTKPATRRQPLIAPRMNFCRGMMICISRVVVQWPYATMTCISVHGTAKGTVVVLVMGRRAFPKLGWALTCGFRSPAVSRLEWRFNPTEAWWSIVVIRHYYLPEG
jgi:hypothetical protein